MTSRRIVAVCVVRNGAAILQRTLVALASQTVPVDVTIIVDLGSTDESPKIIQQTRADLVISLPNRRRFGDAVNEALTQLAARDAEILGDAGAREVRDADWVWLISQDNTPHPDALRALTHEAEVSPSVAVVGPKLVRPEDAAQLIEFGQTMTVTGSTVHLAAGELDQGQFAKQSDVLAVAATGMLVKRTLWDELDGLDPALPRVDAGLDFSIRARLAKHRVVVAPDARVAYSRRLNLFSRPGSPVLAIRKAQLHRRLSYSNLLFLPFIWLLMLPEALIRGVLVLLNKQPRRVLPEIVAAFGAMFAFGAIAQSRKRFRRTKKLSMRSLDSLRRSAAESRRVSALGREHYREQRLGSTQPLQFLFGGGALTILILLGVGIVAYGTFWSGNHLFGGGATPLGSLETLWRNALWHADVLASPQDPFSLVLALLGSLTFWNPSFSLVLLYLVALPLAGLGAWFFLARLDTSQLVRASAAIIWAVSPMFLTALAEGRIGAIVFHIVLPWLAFTTAGAARSLSAAGATSLLLLVAAASAPSATPLLIICWAVLLFWQAKRSYRLILIPLPLAVAFAPLVIFHLAHGSVLTLLADPGLAVDYVHAQAWELALGFPEAGFGGWYAWFISLNNPALITGILLAILLAPLGISAVLSLMSKRFLLGAGALLLSLAGFLAALATTHINITSIALEPVAIWPGNNLSIYWFGLVIALGASLGRLRFGLIQVLALVGAILASLPLLLAPLLGNALVTANGRVLPAIVNATAVETDDLGTLVISPYADGGLRVELLRGVGPRIDQQQTINYVLDSTDKGEQQTELEQIAVNLVSGIGDDGVWLAESKIHYVLLAQLPGDSSGFALNTPADQNLTAAVTANYLTGLNSVFELQPVGTTSVGELWALDPAIIAEHPAQLPEAQIAEPAGPDRLWSYALIGVILFALLMSLPTRRTAPAGVDAGWSVRDRAAESDRRPETASAAVEPSSEVQSKPRKEPKSEQVERGGYFSDLTGYTDLADLDAEAAARDAEEAVVVKKRKNPLAFASQSVLVLIAIGTATVTVGGASILELPRVDLNPQPAMLVSPSAASGTVVCSPSFLNYGIDQGTGLVDLQNLGTTPQRVTASMLLKDPSNGLSGPLALEENVVDSQYPGSPPVSYSLAEANVAGNLLITGAQSQVIATERIAGFVASECVETRTSGWLLAGSNATGRSTVLTLVNPNPVATSIELVFYGEQGRVVSRGITLQANSMHAESIASHTPNVNSPVVQVTSRGGPIAAFLSEGITRVLNSGGAEQVSFAPSPATLQTVPLLQLNNQAYVGDLAGESAINDARPSLRLFNPNTELATVTVQVLAQSVLYDANVTPATVDVDTQLNVEGGPDLGDVVHFQVQVEVLPGTSLDYYLPALPDGQYSLTLASDQPVLGAARGSNPQLMEIPAVNPNSPPRIEYRADFDWAYPSAAFFGEQLVTVAPGPNPMLVLTSRHTDVANVTLSGSAVASSGGRSDPLTVTLRAGEQLLVPVETGQLRLAGLANTHLAIAYVGDAQLASYTLSEQRSAGEAVWIY